MQSNSFVPKLWFLSVITISVKTIRIVIQATCVLLKAPYNRTHGFGYCAFGASQDYLACLHDDRLIFYIPAVTNTG